MARTNTHQAHGNARAMTSSPEVPQPDNTHIVAEAYTEADGQLIKEAPAMLAALERWLEVGVAITMTSDNNKGRCQGGTCHQRQSRGGRQRARDTPSQEKQE